MSTRQQPVIRSGGRETYGRETARPGGIRVSVRADVKVLSGEWLRPERRQPAGCERCRGRVATPTTKREGTRVEDNSPDLASSSHADRVRLGFP